MTLYMLNNPNWGYKVPMGGWAYLSTGEYIGPNMNDAKNIQLHTRTYGPGTHTIDNKSAMYLFAEGIP